MNDDELLPQGKMRRLIEMASCEAFYQYSQGQRRGFGDSDLNKAMFVALHLRITLLEFGVLKGRDPAPVRKRKK